MSVAKDLRMPQFAMKRITTNKCNSQYHMGTEMATNVSSRLCELALAVWKGYHSTWDTFFAISVHTSVPCSWDAEKYFLGDSVLYCTESPKKFFPRP